MLDIQNSSMVFENNSPYFFAADAIIVIRSEASFPRGYSTIPQFRDEDNRGDSVMNFIVSALFEGFVGMENFGQISVGQETRFVLPLGSAPFQFNNAVTVSRCFSEVYQRNQEVLLLNLILRSIDRTFHQLNTDFYAIMSRLFFHVTRSGNPVQNSSTVISREFLAYYYKHHFGEQPPQYQQLFLDIVNLCKQFSFYVSSFMDTDFQLLRTDSVSDQLQLISLLKEIEEFQQVSRELMKKYVAFAQCSEVKYSVCDSRGSDV